MIEPLWCEDPSHKLYHTIGRDCPCFSEDNVDRLIFKLDELKYVIENAGRDANVADIANMMSGSSYVHTGYDGLVHTVKSVEDKSDCIYRELQDLNKELRETNQLLRQSLQAQPTWISKVKRLFGRGRTGDKLSQN